MEETNDRPAGSSAGSSDEGTDGRFGRAREAYSQASDKVRDGYNAVREKVDDVDFGAVTDQVRTFVRSNPGKALLISVGIGFVVGLILRSDEDEE
jgi:ElaB/YqjD/DUF883 family membrane-anchored ribosome-binding protein